MSEHRRCGGCLTTAATPTRNPDFRVTGTDRDGDRITVPVYWRSSSWFETETQYDNPVGAAYPSQPAIYLNEQYDLSIDHSVVAHEFGHIIGYGHIDGTVMGSSPLKMGDKQQKGHLEPESIDIFERLDGCHVARWGDNGIRSLGIVATAYSRRQIGIKTLGYAASLYAKGTGESAWFRTDWGKYGGYAGVSAANTGPGFYRV